MVISYNTKLNILFIFLFFEIWERRGLSERIFAKLIIKWSAVVGGSPFVLKWKSIMLESTFSKKNKPPYDILLKKFYICVCLKLF